MSIYRVVVPFYYHFYVEAENENKAVKETYSSKPCEIYRPNKKEVKQIDKIRWDGSLRQFKRWARCC